MESFIITFLFKVQLYYQSKCSVLKKILKKKNIPFSFLVILLSKLNMIDKKLLCPFFGTFFCSI